MPRRTLVVMDCDKPKCRQEGDLYTVRFPDGQEREFILCDRHAGAFKTLREADYGTWKRKGRGFRKTPIEDLTS